MGRTAHGRHQRASSLTWSFRDRRAMSRRLARVAVQVAMSVLGLMLIVFTAYGINGSLEEFPTDEQQDTVRTVSGVLVALLILAEAALWLLLRRLDRAGAS